MNFDRITALARRTPNVVLGDALGLSQKEIDSRLNGRESMTVRDLGGLADIHGMGALLDALDGSVDEIARSDA